MQYRSMKTNNDPLSILGFGCMRFVTDAENNIDREIAFSIMRKAFESGVNYFDTGWPYHGGKSENLLGDFIQTVPRDQIRIADKLPCWLIKNHSDMEFYLEQQLGKLQTDYIDYYLLHALNKNTWKTLLDNDVFGFIQRAKAAGKIRNIGFSFHDQYSVFEQIVDTYDWDFCQIQLNYIDTEEQAGMKGLHYAAAKGMGIIVMEPVKGGKLAGHIPSEIEQVWDRSSYRISPAARALKWVWNMPEVTLLLSGMNTMAQVDENIAIANSTQAEELDAQEMSFYEEVRSLYLKKMPLQCTGCQYCLPCPHNVAIPSNFSFYMDAHIFGDKARHMREYNYFISEEKRADKCVQCGVCVSKCPQNINIPEEMLKVAKYFAE